jgi:hypothetical protein
MLKTFVQLPMCRCKCSKHLCNCQCVVVNAQNICEMNLVANTIIPFFNHSLFQLICLLLRAFFLKEKTAKISPIINHLYNIV